MFFFALDNEQYFFRFSQVLSTKRSELFFPESSLIFNDRDIGFLVKLNLILFFNKKIYFISQFILILWTTTSKNDDFSRTFFQLWRLQKWLFFAVIKREIYFEQSKRKKKEFLRFQGKYPTPIHALTSIKSHRGDLTNQNRLMSYSYHFDDDYEYRCSYN